MSWSYVVTARAQRDIKKLDPQVRRRVGEAIKRLVATYPESANVIKLQGTDQPEWRLRVGDWRVRFSSDEAAQLIIITRILPRGSAYKR